MAEEYKKKVPSWDGTPEKWDTYVIKTGIFMKTQPEWKAPNLIAELMQRLEGRAWDLIEQISEEQQEKLVNRKIFLQFLKESLLESAVPELGRFFRKWQGFKRQRRETMKLYVLRHRHVLGRLEKAMQSVDDGKELYDKVTKLVEGKKRVLSMVDGSATSKSSKARTSKASSVRSSVKSEQEEAEEERDSYSDIWPNASDGGARTWTSGKGKGKSQKTPDEPWEDKAHIHWWSAWSWWDQKGWGNQDWKDTKSDKGSEMPVLPKSKIEELSELLALAEFNDEAKLDALIKLVTSQWRETCLPDLLTGWHLLQKSGLGAQERATVLAAASKLRAKKAPQSG